MTDNAIQLALNPKEMLQGTPFQMPLENYFELLRDANQKVNLVSRETIASGLPLLAAESLLPLAQVDHLQFARYLDIGSGGGFPAIPIILSRQCDEAVLLERREKKATELANLAQRIKPMKTSVQVLCQTFEEYQESSPFNLITMRLVKLTPQLMKRIWKLVSKDGLFVYYAALPIDCKEARMDVITYSYTIDNCSLLKYFTILKNR